MIINYIHGQSWIVHNKSILCWSAGYFPSMLQAIDKDLRTHLHVIVYLQIYEYTYYIDILNIYINIYIYEYIYIWIYIWIYIYDYIYTCMTIYIHDYIYMTIYIWLYNKIYIICIYIYRYPSKVGDVASYFRWLKSAPIPINWVLQDQCRRLSTIGSYSGCRDLPWNTLW